MCANMISSYPNTNLVKFFRLAREGDRACAKVYIFTDFSVPRLRSPPTNNRDEWNTGVEKKLAMRKWGSGFNRVPLQGEGKAFAQQAHLGNHSSDSYGEVPLIFVQQDQEGHCAGRHQKAHRHCVDCHKPQHRPV